MEVVIVGCGQVGSSLAYQLYRKGHQVTVIDTDGSAFDNLPVDFKGRTIEGDVLTRNVLRRAEIEAADALVAVTSSDSLNALVAHIAKTDYRVAKVVARNNNPRLLPLQEAFGIPVIGSALWGAHRIEELLSDDVLHVLYSDGRTNIAIYQLVVPESGHGRSLKDFLPDDRCKVLTLIRAGHPLPLSDAQTFETGDLIYLSAGQEEIEALHRRLISNRSE